MTHHKIVLGDSRSMESVNDASVDLVITSPPYWQLKDYGSEDQTGFHDTYEEYVHNLNLVWMESARVLREGCRLCVNIGDQFARSVYYGRYKVIPIRTEIIKFCESIGFDYMGGYNLAKVTTTNTTGGGAVMGSYPYPRNGILKLDYEFILLFKKYGKPPKIEKERKEQSRMTPQEWNEYFSGHWNFPGEKQGAHLAMFPIELPSRLIKMFSFVGDTVLDPFLGSGTTSLAAANLDRNSIGYEINNDFLPIIREKLGMDTVGLFNDREFTVEHQAPVQDNLLQRLDGLPYSFQDLVKLDAKVSPKARGFGSKIDGKEKQIEDLHSVKDISAPDTMVLDTGLKVKLLGVEPIEARRKEAVEFLRKKTKGQKVFLRFDKEKYDDKNELIGYVYLRNKTFLNAHLIKAGLVNPDSTCHHRYAKKFQRYQEELNG